MASREALGGVMFGVPDGWVAEHQAVLRLPQPSDGEIGFQANIVIARRAAPAGRTIEQVAEDHGASITQELPALAQGELYLGQLCGHRAARMTYRWGDGDQLAQLVILCVVGSWLYQITYTDVAPRYPESVAAFDRWLAGIQLRAPAGGADRALGALGLAAFARPGQ